MRERERERADKENKGTGSWVTWEDMSRSHEEVTWADMSRSHERIWAGHMNRSRGQVTWADMSWSHGQIWVAHMGWTWEHMCRHEQVSWEDMSRSYGQTWEYTGRDEQVSWEDMGRSHEKTWTGHLDVWHIAWFIYKHIVPLAESTERPIRKPCIYTSFWSFRFQSPLWKQQQQQQQQQQQLIIIGKKDSFTPSVHTSVHTSAIGAESLILPKTHSQYRAKFKGLY